MASLGKGLLPAFVGTISGLLERPAARQYIPPWLPMVLGMLSSVGLYFAEDGSIGEEICETLVQAASNWLGEWGFEGTEPGTDTTVQALAQEIRAIREMLESRE